MAIVTISKWFPEKGFGFVSTNKGSAFLHATVIIPRPTRDADLNGQQIDIIGTEFDQEKRKLRVTGANLLPTADNPDAPESLMGWRVKSPEIIQADLRKGRQLKIQDFSIEEAREKGCPKNVLEECEGWIDMIRSFGKPVYKPRERAKVDDLYIEFVIPEVGIKVEDDTPEDESLQKFHPAKSYHGEWIFNGLLRPWQEGCFYHLSLFVTKDTYQDFILECIDHNWHPIAIGDWGSNRRNEGGWRFVDDSQVCAILEVEQQDFPELRLPLSGHSTHEEDIIARWRLKAGYPSERPSYNSCLTVTTHADLLYKLAGSETCSADWTYDTAQFTVNTGIERPRLSGQVVELPLNWGLVSFSGRDITGEILAQGNETVFKTGKRVVVMGPVGSEITILLRWWKKAGKHSEWYRWPVKLTFLENGVLSETVQEAPTSVEEF